MEISVQRCFKLLVFVIFVIFDKYRLIDKPLDVLSQCKSNQFNLVTESWENFRIQNLSVIFQLMDIFSAPVDQIELFSFALLQTS